MKILEFDMYNGTDLVTFYKVYVPSIKKLLLECFGSNYRILPGIWILTFTNEYELMGLLYIDSNNIIWNLCTSNKFRKKGIATVTLNYALNKLQKENKIPSLFIDLGKGDILSNNLNKFYQKFGFKSRYVINNNLKMVLVD
jgi:hypothetical protein